MVFFFSNMIENQLMSTGAFEVTLNGESLLVCMFLFIAAVDFLWCYADDSGFHLCSTKLNEKKLEWKCNKIVLHFCRCAGVVKTGVGSSSLHAAAGTNTGQWDEDERSHEHKATPTLLTLFFTSWLKLKAPPCKYNSPLGAVFTKPTGMFLLSPPPLGPVGLMELFKNPLTICCHSPPVQVWGGFLIGLWGDVHEGLCWRQEDC